MTTRARRYPLATLLGLLAPAPLGLGAPTDEWPGFRGPRIDGVSAAPAPWTRVDKLEFDVLWELPVGSGYSGSAVAEGLAVTLAVDGMRDAALAFDAETGKLVWKYDLGDTYKGHDGSHDGPISTPLIAGGKVYCLSPRGVFVALDAKTGQAVWSLNLAEKCGGREPFYGYASSPALIDGVLIVGINAEKASVGGFDPATGELLWKGVEGAAMYESPALRQTPTGEFEALITTADHVTAVAPRSGEQRWQFKTDGSASRGAASHHPILGDDGLVFVNALHSGSVAFRVATREGALETAPLWDTRDVRNTWSIPIYHDGHIYAYSSRFLNCLDARTGKELWRSREPGDGWLVRSGDRLVICTKDGSLHVAKATPRGYEEIGSMKLFDDLIWHPPTLAYGRIYVRGLSGFKCIAPRAARGDESAVAESERGQPKPGVFADFLARAARAAHPKTEIEAFLAQHPQTPFTEPGQMHFLYYGPATDVALGGDLIGARREQQMHRLPNSDLFYYSVPLEDDAAISYCFVRDYEEIADPRNPVKERSNLLGKDMEMAFGGDTNIEVSWATMPEWRAPDYLGEAPPAQRGELHEHEFESAALEVKVPLQIYTPAGYESGNARYPVAFVHDGPGAREQGRYQHALDNLIPARVAPIIVVFIGDAQTRAGPPKHLQFFADELVPFVDANYRTVAAPEARAHIGQGFPAYTAALMAVSRPDVAQKLGVQSAFLFDSMTAAFNRTLESADLSKLQVYHDWGKYDFRNPHEAWDLGERNREFGAQLQPRAARYVGGRVNSGTDWPCWRTRTHQLLAALFPPEQRSQ